MRARRLLVLGSIAVLAVASCSGADPSPDGVEASASSSAAAGGQVDVGGYELAFMCEGEGSPTVVLEAGLDSAGTSTWLDFMGSLDDLDVRVCTYDRAGTGSSDPRPESAGVPTAELQAKELDALLTGAEIAPPYVLVPHSYGGLVARMFADLRPDDVAGFVFEDVSTAWEIDLWPKWDDSPWIDGGQETDIQATEEQVLAAEPLEDRPSIVVSAGSYDFEGIPDWAGPIFLRQAGKLAALGSNAIHVRATGTGHFIHEERPPVMIEAITAVVESVRTGEPLPGCEDVFSPDLVECLS